MSDEIVPLSNEITIRDYIDLLRRRKAIIIQTFVVVLIVGVVMALMAKPVFRSNSRILLEVRGLSLTQINSADPLSGLFAPDQGHDIATQVEVLQGDAVVNRAFELARVPPGAVRLDVKQVGT